MEKFEFENLIFMNKKIYDGGIYKMILIFLFCFACIVSLLKIDIYYKCIGTYNEELITINVKLEEISSIKKSEFLIIDEYKYLFDIERISEDIYVDSLKNINYQEVKINVDENFIENELLELKFFVKKECIYMYVVNKIIGKE